MDSLDEIFAIIIDNYKNQFITEGTNPTKQNKTFLGDAEKELNDVFTQLNDSIKDITDENTVMRKKIVSVNSIIKKTKKNHGVLDSESTRLINSELGAIEQNKNSAYQYKKNKTKLILKVGLIVIILILLYINEDILQAIRGRLSTKPQ